MAVGTGSSSWPTYEQQNQSTFNPPWVATSWADLDGSLTGNKSADPTYLKNVVTTAPTPSPSSQWQEPGVQQCVHTIKKAYPSDSMVSPVNQPASQASVTTYTAPINSCIAVGLFEAIAKAAGKTLTTSSFTKAGYGLRSAICQAWGSRLVRSGSGLPLGSGLRGSLRQLDRTDRALLQVGDVRRAPKSNPDIAIMVARSIPPWGDVNFEAMIAAVTAIKRRMGDGEAGSPALI